MGYGFGLDAEPPKEEMDALLRMSKNETDLIGKALECLRSALLCAKPRDKAYRKIARAILFLEREQRKQFR